MDGKWLPGAAVLGAALVLGLLADRLMSGSGLGLNAFVWFSALAAAMIAVAHWVKRPLTGGGRWLLPAVMGFSFAIMWRDSPTLTVCNVLAILMALSLVMVRGRFGRLGSLGILQTVLCAALAFINVCVGAILLVACDIPWLGTVRDFPAGRAMPAIRGILLAVPLLIVFGALFAAADANFSRLVSRLWQFDSGAVVMHCCWITMFGWASAGLLRGTLMRDDDTLASIEKPDSLSIGATEAAIVLGSLNALFLLFACMQLPYLFGGQAHVFSTAGLTAADYARRGFFELVTIAGLVLPLLLGSQALLSSGARARTVFKWLAISLAALTYLVMASAVQRMALYYTGFGLTELRFYTTVFMIWVGAVMLYFCANVLREKRAGFARAALLIAFGFLAVLDAVGPDRLIVRANASRLSHGHVFDVNYNAELSADAVPELTRLMPSLPPDERAALALSLRERWMQLPREDWRSFNIDRSTARSAVLLRAQAIRSLTDSVSQAAAAPAAAAPAGDENASTPSANLPAQNGDSP